MPRGVLGSRWNLVRLNRGAQRLLACFPPASADGFAAARNLLLGLVHADAFAPYIVNWDEVASSVVMRLHHEIAGRPGDGGATDVAYSALSLLRKLAGTLADAGRFIAACRTLEARATKRDRRWGVPPLFFFDKHAQAEWEAVRPTPPDARRP